jgi:hypothetical protein
MDDQIGSILARVASTLEANDAEIKRLEALKKNIPRILPRLPDQYWHKLDANAGNQVVVHPDTPPFEATFSGGAANSKANYHVLRPVIVRRNGTPNASIADGGLFVHTDGTFFAFNQARESARAVPAKLTISHSYWITLTGKDLHLFETSLTPFLRELQDNLSREAQNELLSEFSARSILRMANGLFTDKPIEAINGALSALFKIAASFGFAMVFCHLHRLGYIPKMSAESFAQLYLSLFAAAAVKVLGVAVLLISPYLFCRLIGEDAFVSARSKLHVALTLSQIVFLTAIFLVADVMPNNPLGYLLPLGVAALSSAVIARFQFAVNAQPSWLMNRWISFLLWTCIGSLVPLLLSLNAVGRGSFGRVKTWLILALCFALTALINRSLVSLFPGRAQNHNRLPVVISLGLVVVFLMWLSNPYTEAFRSFGLGYLERQRIFVNKHGRDQIANIAHVVPVSTSLPDRWYVDNAEVISKIGDPVLVSIPVKKVVTVRDSRQ